MTAGRTRTALVVEASPRWRAAVAACLRDAGWTVFAHASLPQPAGGLRYDLAVLEAPAPAETAAWLDQLAASGTRCVLLPASAAPLPAALAQHPAVAGSLPRSSFSPEALLALAGAQAKPAAAPQPEEAAGPRVLVVEDDPQWRAVYEELLAEAVCAPTFAVSYGEARGWLQRVSFALALVDLNLASSAAPEGNRDGFFLLRAARQRGVPAIVISALGDPADIDRAYDEFGIFAFVEKEGFDRRIFLRLLAEALRAPAAPAPEAGPPPDGLQALTPREREVLGLLIQGCTNPQIAEALLITPNTAKKHVDHILQKLGVSTRAAAVAAALRRGGAG